MSVWEPTTTEWICMLVAALGSLLLLFWWMPKAYPKRVANFTADNEWHRKVVELERDRVVSAAKGLASTSAGFLVALATALFKAEVNLAVSAWSLIGCVAGAVGVLVLAGTVTASTRRYLWDPAAE